MNQPTDKQRGFTLLEVLLAMAIFAALSLMAYQLLSLTLETHQRTRAANEQFAALQRTVNWMGNDFHQIVARKSRNMTAVLQTDPNSIAFTTQTWENDFGNCCVPSLQSVTWYVKDGTLHRAVMNGPDGLQTQLDIALLSKVQNMRVRYYEAGWQDAAPLDTLPKALEITIDVVGFGEIRRVYILPAPWPVPETEQTDGKQQNDGTTTQSAGDGV
jgi:general secretion pathway protein J